MYNMTHVKFWVTLKHGYPNDVFIGVSFIVVFVYIKDFLSMHNIPFTNSKF